MIIKNVTTIGINQHGNRYLDLEPECPTILDVRALEQDSSRRVYIDNVNDVHILNDSTVAIETPQPSAAHK